MTPIFNNNRSNALDDFAGLFRGFDRLFQDALSATTPCEVGARTQVYQYSDDSAYTIRVEVPGFSKDEVSLALEDGILTVTARNQEASETPQRKVAQKFQLPDDVEIEGIEAELRDGLLTLTLPKAAPAEPEKRTIEIK